jgi:hypothetical protein
LDALQSDQNIAGTRLYDRLQAAMPSNPTELIEQLVNTKLPQIFAESKVYGDGSDWNQTELSILGLISFAVPVLVFDDATHAFPSIHKTPFPATLLFVPGVLLRNGRGQKPLDWHVVDRTKQINYATYLALYELKLLPVFKWVNADARKSNTNAVVTVPGLGAGQFAGPFRGQIGALFAQVLKDLIERHAATLPNVEVIYYDPYDECENRRQEIGGVSFRIRPYTQRSGKAQLCEITDYEEEGDDLRNLKLYSIVAWDHVSWPGNDFYGGTRATDDGVKAAATDLMCRMTQIQGTYNSTNYSYEPPLPFRNWEEVVISKNLELYAKENLIVSSG